METLIGFVIGYVVGTRQGREGLQKAREALDAIRNSDEVRQMVVTGAAVAGGAVKQVLGGGAGAVLTGVVDALSRKAADVLGGPHADTRQAT